MASASTAAIFDSDSVVSAAARLRLELGDELKSPLFIA